MITEDDLLDRLVTIIKRPHIAPKSEAYNRWVQENNLQTWLGRLKSKHDNDRIHAFMMQLAEHDPTREATNKFKHSWRVEFWGVYGQEHGTATNNSQRTFNTELRAFRHELEKPTERQLGFNLETDGVKGHSGLRYRVSTMRTSKAVIHLAEMELNVEMVRFAS